jgi:hypothetical protein
MLIIVVLCCALAPGGAAEALLVEDFEGLTAPWNHYDDGKGSSLELHVTLNQHKLGDGALQVDYNRIKGGWCGFNHALASADWSAYTHLRFWYRMQGGKGLEVRLTDGGNEGFIATLENKEDGAWQRAALAFADFKRNPGYQAAGASTDGKLDLDKLAELNFTPLGDGPGRLWLDHIDVAAGADAAPAPSKLAEPKPIKMFELEAPVAKKAATVVVDGAQLGGRLSPVLASGVGDEVGEFAASPDWQALLKESGVPLLRVNARLDRFAKANGYDFAALDRDIAALKEAGAEPLVVVDGTPPVLGKPRDNPKDVEAWADLAASLVKHVNADGKRAVTYWQIWDQSDSKSAWTGKSDEYATLAAKAAGKMKQADSGIVVLAGSFTRAAAVGELGPRLVELDQENAIDGLSWSGAALDKSPDTGGADYLDRTWGFEKTAVEVEMIASHAGRPLAAAMDLASLSGDRGVFNPRIDTALNAVYFASLANHLARQNALCFGYFTATPQRRTGLVDGTGTKRPVFQFLKHFNAVFRGKDWYWVDADASTAAVEALAAVSGNDFVLMLVNKDCAGGQYDTAVKLEGLKATAMTVWELGRSSPGTDEPRPLPTGALKLTLPPLTVAFVRGTLAEPAATPSAVPEALQSASRLAVGISSIDRARHVAYGEDAAGKRVALLIEKATLGDAKGVAVNKPFAPGQKVEVSGKRKGGLVVVDKAVLLGAEAGAGAIRPSDSGFNLAERLKGRPVLAVERIKAPYDVARVFDLPVKPALVFSAKQIMGDTKHAVTNEADFSAKVRLAWNDENLYVVATVQDDTFFQSNTTKPEDYWSADSLQLGFDFGCDSLPGVNDENDAELLCSAKDGKGQGVFVVAPRGLKKGASISESVKFQRPSNDSWQIAVMVPWATVGFVPAPGRRFAFNLVLNEADSGGGREGWFQWTPGMDKPKAQDFAQFGVIELH